MKALNAAAALTVASALLLVACGGGGGGSSSPAPNPTVMPTSSSGPTASPTATASGTQTAYTCPSTGTASFARSGFGTVEARTRAMFVAPHGVSTPANTLLAVSYTRAALASRLSLVAAREQALGATFVRTTDYPALNTTLRVVSVPTAKVASTESALRAQAGVQSIGVTGEKRYPLTTSAFYTNDPYFTGFGPDFETLPYAEASAVPGQWDMHAIGLEHAFGYVNGGTGVAATANALGSSSIKIAIIDTGEDASHPELNSKIAYQRCFITNPSNVQSTGNYATDALGHGTDVSGIAAAASNNSLGFVGAGGKAVIYAYRVFPTPDDNCANENNSDDQCTSSTADIASAIDDAIAQHVNIISMSLGGGSCTGGVDSDPDERAAIASAIAANIVVVAAAGNGSTSTLDAPACDTGVIAVGATGLDDGSALGTGTTNNYTKNVSGASANNPIEYVASYSQYATPSQMLHSASAWGIVAPGGDPSSTESQTNGPTPDDLHWIENIWTSTPYQSSANDNSFTGNCTSDFDASGTIDCRTLIAGTSMATPHVAGAAALILAVTGGLSSPYQSPAAMKQLLCQTADEINDTHEGCGRLNVYRAMATVLGDTNLP